MGRDAAQRLQGDRAVDTRPAARAATATVTADGHVDRAGCLPGETQACGDGATAVATATADALRQDAGGAVTHRAEVAAVVSVHRAAVARRAGRAADTDVNGGRIHTATGEACTDGQAAVAAAATNGLDHHAIRPVTARADIGREAGEHIARVAAGTAGATQPNAEVARRRTRRAQRGRHGRTRITAAAAHALHDDTVGLVVARRDCTTQRDGHRTAGAAQTAAATQRDAGRTGRTITERGRRRYGVATIATATAHGLGEEPRREMASRVDEGVDVRTDSATVTTGVAGTTERHRTGQREALTGGQRGRHGGATIATTTADGLDDHTRGDIATGRDVTRTGQRDRAACATRRALAADGDTDIDESAGTRLDGIATRTTTTTDRLRENAGRAVFIGQDGRGHQQTVLYLLLELNVDIATPTRGTAITADTHAEEETAGIGITGSAATAAHRLRMNTQAVCTGGMDGAANRHLDKATVATRAAIAADRNDDAIGRSATAAAAAHRLGEDALRTLAGNGKVAATGDNDRAALGTRAVTRTNTAKREQATAFTTIAAAAADGLRMDGRGLHTVSGDIAHAVDRDSATVGTRATGATDAHEAATKAARATTAASGLRKDAARACTPSEQVRIVHYRDRAAIGADTAAAAHAAEASTDIAGATATAHALREEGH